MAIQSGSNGHYSIVPTDGIPVAVWAETRNNVVPSPWTLDVKQSIIGEIRK